MTLNGSARVAVMAAMQQLLATDSRLVRAQKIVANLTAIQSGLNVLVARVAGIDLPPVAAITYTQPDSMSVAVSGSGSSDPDGTVAGYRWDFGDGTLASSVTATHTYKTAGVWVVTLTVTDDKGATATATQNVTAVSNTPVQNDPPTASFTAKLASDGFTLAVDGSASNDRDGSITAYAWTFGDGATASGQTASHAYTQSGTFTVGLTVTDNSGATSSPASQSVTVSIPSTPVTTSTGSGDSGVNQTGKAGLQQTGSGIVLEQNLTAGSDLTATVKGAAGSVVSFAAGTFSWKDFTHGVDGGASGSGNSSSGLQFPSGIKGVLGAGSASTILEMTPSSSTKSSTVPSSGTNQLQYIDLANVPNGFVWDGLNMVGTGQGHLYNGLRLKAPGNSTFSNSTFSGIPGNSGSPPGETFTVNLYAQGSGSTVNFKNDTFESKQQGGTSVAAAMLGTNSTAGVINVTDCVFNNSAYSAAIAIWELAAGGTINIYRPVTKNCHRNIGNEAQAGTINIYDPMLGDPSSGEDDIRITWTANYHEGTINVYFTSQAKWQAFIANRTNKKLITICSVKQAYGGSAGGAYTGSKSILDYCHVFIGGVEQNRADYWTISGSPSN